MPITGWIATHTGLPSIMATGKEPVYAGDRLFAVPGMARDKRPLTGRAKMIRELEGPKLTEPVTMILSDAYAVPGTTIKYTQGDSSVTLTRPEVEWWRGMVSGLNGRTVPGLIWEEAQDKREWSSPISRYNSLIARWPMLEVARTGGGQFVLDDPSHVNNVWEILQKREPLILTPGAPADVLPSRFITVDKVDSARITGDGIIRWNVKWHELPEDSPMLVGPHAGWGSAPCVTWGEWREVDKVWKSRTYIEICKMIAGMP